MVRKPLITQGYSLAEEVANSISHGIGLVFGIVGLVLLLVQAVDTNASATAIAMLDHIEAQDVTCMTNMGKAILLESVRPNVSLMLTGGEIRPPRTSLTGVGAISAIEKVTAAKCFLGCTGLSAEYGLTSATSPEPAVNAMMLERSKYHVILADSSKLGVTSSFQFGSADEIDLLITDTGATDTQVALLSMAGVKKILRVDPSMPSAAPIVS